MKKRWKAVSAALAILAVCTVAFGLPIVAGGEEVGYWDRFKMLFVDWDDNAQPGAAHTEVTGCRGVDVEQKLGAQGYDWDAVLYMENFSVSMDVEKSFLQAGKLGPFKAQ